MAKKILFGIFIWLLIVGVYHTNKALPGSVGQAGPVHHVSSEDVTFFVDRTFVDAAGTRYSEQEIFDEVLRMIDEAEQYVLVDMFFYSDFNGIATTTYRQLSSELTDALIAKKRANPSVVMQVITDPINVMYGGQTVEQFDRLEAAGIPVIITELKSLRDSNPLYSTMWRTFFQWFGVSSERGWLPHPLDANGPKLGLRTYLKMLNYKANHRKLVVTDYQRDDVVGYSTLITSANPHDGSSAHSNIALRIDAALWRDVIASEGEVAWWSDAAFVRPEGLPTASSTDESTEPLTVQLLTEHAIERAVIDSLAIAEAGDRVDIAMFYIADRDIVSALREADGRGVEIRLLFDANKDAFGREKNGMPNRQVAHELVSNSAGNTVVRWCDTHGEQCHSKLYLKTTSDRFDLIQGSANFTRRNLDNLNLETNVRVQGAVDAALYRDVSSLYTLWWTNTEDEQYSVSYDVYEDTSWFRTVQYRFMEWTGLSRW